MFPLSKIFAVKKVGLCEKSRLVENRLDGFVREREKKTSDSIFVKSLIRSLCLVVNDTRIQFLLIYLEWL